MPPRQLEIGTPLSYATLCVYLYVYIYIYIYMHIIERERERSNAQKMYLSNNEWISNHKHIKSCQGIEHPSAGFVKGHSVFTGRSGYECYDEHVSPIRISTAQGVDPKPKVIQGLRVGP